MSVQITAIIHTLNEEANIANALRSVARWANEVIVVDMHSEDRTVEIARSLGARVLLHERTGFVEPARRFAEEEATGEWIFVLDADEIAPPELISRLREIAEKNLADICRIPRLNYFGGRPLLHSGWGPEQDCHARFYRRGAIEYSSRIHAAPQHKPGSQILTLRYAPGTAILHFNYLNASHFLAKLNRYTDIEAAQKAACGKRVGISDFLLRPLAIFIDRSFRKQGFRDGWPGFYYCALMSVYRLTTAMKQFELQRTGSAEEVRRLYQATADEQVARQSNAAKHSSS
jgi:glycosyltransferase involved in cell wall biosynthesis